MCSLISSFCRTRRSSMSSLENKLLDEESSVVKSSGPKMTPKKPGWKAMPYILGNETVERLASFGIITNFMVYLLKEYNMDQVQAANILNTWTSVSNVLPVFGAFVADEYLGKFLTMAIASFATLTGMVVVTLTSCVPQLRPSPCPLEEQQDGVCKGYTNFQLGVLLLALFWLCIGAGGITPCSIPFGIDQFDLTTAEGREGTRSFYNMYYVIQTVLLMFNVLVVVKIQESYSWTLGFFLPTMFMVIAIVFFFSGAKIYCHVKPEGSILSRIYQVLVVAKNKRHLPLPLEEDIGGAFYDPPPLENNEEVRLPLTKEFSWLNKAALVMENELNDDGSSKDPWRLCSIQQVEELKCMLKMLPIWLTGFIVNTAAFELSIFSISQALQMNRNIGFNYEVPPASMVLVSMMTLAIVMPIYDRVISPALAKITKQEGGLTTLQRIGFGHIFAIITMLVGGFVEFKRRGLANLQVGYSSSDGVAPMSVVWLAPQFMFLALTEVFSVVGYIEFFNKESPDRMRSIGYSLFFLQYSFGSNLSSLLVNIIHDYTGKNGQPDWLDSDINKGRLEYFYFIIAGLGMLNLCGFFFCSLRYSYKTVVIVKAGDTSALH
ncbi:hypothetical protein RIF29_15800 [Crotalaria pallida]|uniref:Uncharacterized protein n=1 Tax=Crotalaria pallida TaxID=3830 RepID=A0AAN9IBH2_CROPI